MIRSFADKQTAAIFAGLAVRGLPQDIQKRARIKLKMIDAAKIGDVMEVLRTSRGYQVLKLESRTDTRVRTFEDARADIGNRVAEQKRQGELQKYLDRQREQAIITWRNTDLKTAYEQALTKRQAAANAAGHR